MSKVIASTYEILEEIGSGGGGVVYLGRHLRLNKMIVLKADKRSLNAKEETLRREVDALKKLNHTYIPTVYDFVQEDGVVYTVMDYIEGESLDKPLKRKEQFSQPQIIEWACELLEALIYLHSRPPYGILHSDIKPSNIMIEKGRETEGTDRPEGSILKGCVRLIDFNIALALGEEGAVRVGRSLGYASPEHYGQDFSQTGGPSSNTASAFRRNRGRRRGRNQTDTEMLESSVRRSSSVADSGSSGGSRSVLLDVRSDIYSLGATLYHLLTGERPAQDARDVKPFSAFPDRTISPSVAAIVAKAMDPDPNRRFQSAAEMLYAFEHLHETDRRTRRHHRRMVLAGLVTTLLLAVGGLLTYVGLRQEERIQNALVLAEYSANALRQGDVDSALKLALEALPEESGFLNPPHTPQAQRALANALGIYHLSDTYQPFRRISLSDDAEGTAGKPAKAGLSPDGTRAVTLWNEGNDWWFLVYDTETGMQTARLPARQSVLSECVFRDSSTLIYAGKEGLSAYDLANGETLWGPKEPATDLALSGDGNILAAVHRDAETAYIYNAHTGELIRTVDFAGRHLPVESNDVYADRDRGLFELSGNGKYLAVSFANEGLRLKLFDLDNLENDETDIDVIQNSEYDLFEGGFFGSYFAMSGAHADRDDTGYMIVDLNALKIVKLAADTRRFHMQADESGIFISQGRVVSEIRPETGEEIETAFTKGPDVAAFSHSANGTLVLTTDGRYMLFDRSARLAEESDGTEKMDFVSLAGPYMLTASRDVPALIIRRLGEHDDAVLLTYDRSYRHLEARVSQDRETAVLFGLTSFRVVGGDGQIFAHVDLPDSSEIYDQQYRRRNGQEYLEVIYNDGTIRQYGVKTGELISQMQGDVPDRINYEETFETQNFIVKHPLHGTASLYDRESGEWIRDLESEDDLAYITQIGDGLIAEYYSTTGRRYGVLLDHEGGILADLPDLCDILPTENTLIFDDGNGNLRQSRLYSTDELVGLAKEQRR